MLPEILIANSSWWLKIFWNHIDNHVALCFAVSYLLLAITLLLSKIHTLVGKIFLVIAHFCVIFISVLDVFLYRSFGTHFNVVMLQLMNETNSQESSEFLDTYIFQPSFLSILKIPICLLIIEFAIFYSIKLYKKYRGKKPTAILRYPELFVKGVLLTYIVLCLCYTVIVAPTFTFDWNKNRVRIYDSQLLQYCFIPSSFIYNTYQAFVQFADEGSQFDKCAKSQLSIEAEVPNPLNSKIVLIIGESFNKHHSNLYGYEKNTCPRLSSYDSLYVFDDVIAPINVTSAAFKSLLSFASMDDSSEWYETPLFLTVFKKTGYNVIFYSNQFVKDLDLGPNDASCGFFNLPNIEPNLFTHRNAEKYTYDESLIDEYKLKKDSLEGDSSNCLVLFHLMGQHISPYKRFPEGRAYLTSDDYNRPELTLDEKQQVADYDNATIYNDSIVDQIIKMYEAEDAIIIYFSDHGDEANDFRSHIGRSLLTDSISAPCLHCQLDIPFLVYPTPQFRNTHPDLVERIKASTSRPFMTDDLPHLLLDIANIKSPWYNPSRSLINEQFNSDRKRFVNGYNFDNKTDYDSICDAYGNWEIGY